MEWEIFLDFLSMGIYGADFLVFPCGNVYNKYNSVREWILRGMAILAIRGRQRVYGCILLHRPKERSIDHDTDGKRNDRAA